MINSQYDFYDTGGHGYLAVSKQELIDLGIADKISQFSKIHIGGQIVYLEEDADFAVFKDAKGKFGFRTRHVDLHYFDNGLFKPYAAEMKN